MQLKITIGDTTRTGRVLAGMSRAARIAAVKEALAVYIHSNSGYCATSDKTPEPEDGAGG